MRWSSALSQWRASPPFAALAPAEQLARGPFDDFDGDDGIEVEPETLRLRALEAEDAARAVEGVTNSEGGGASHGTGTTAIATSTGFGGARGGSSHGVSASVLAGEGARMQRDYYGHSSRHLGDLDNVATAFGRLLRTGQKT